MQYYFSYTFMWLMECRTFKVPPHKPHLKETFLTGGGGGTLVPAAFLQLCAIRSSCDRPLEYGLCRSLSTLSFLRVFLIYVFRICGFLCWKQSCLHSEGSPIWRAIIFVVTFHISFCEWILLSTDCDVLVVEVHIKCGLPAFETYLCPLISAQTSHK